MRYGPVRCNRKAHPHPALRATMCTRQHTCQHLSPSGMSAATHACPHIPPTRVCSLMQITRVRPVRPQQNATLRADVCHASELYTCAAADHQVVFNISTHQLLLPYDLGLSSRYTEGPTRGSRQSSGTRVFLRGVRAATSRRAHVNTPAHARSKNPHGRACRHRHQAAADAYGAFWGCHTAALPCALTSAPSPVAPRHCSSRRA